MALGFFSSDFVGPEVPRICIVTPVFNGAAYIDETIASVVSQAGHFVLHYHIQDGGSIDGTERIVNKWRRLCKSGRLPILCRKLIFTYACASDNGMYDAVSKGFAQALPSGDDVLMGWIAADDRIAPGAFATLCAVRRDVPDVRFMGGRITIMNEGGSITDLHPLRPFSKAGLEAGLYDGRRLRFVMQEGTFWCADLWDRVGGIDTRFKLAGDWDLWRRMARQTHYVGIESIVGIHRRRPGQLSEHMAPYYDEVDRTLDDVDLAKRELGLANDGSPQRTLRSLYDKTMAELDWFGFHDKSIEHMPGDAMALRYWAYERRWVRYDWRE